MTDRECTAEFIDGTYDNEGCGCEACCDELHNSVEGQFEQGLITEDEARDRHANLTARGF